jgi:hypothetical protein
LCRTVIDVHDSIVPACRLFGLKLTNLLALLLIGVAATGCGTDAPRFAGSSIGSPALAANRVPFRFFSPTSIWNRLLSVDAPINRNSSRLVRVLVAQIAGEERAERGPWINTVSYSVPIYTVARNQPTVRVQLFGHPREAALKAAWSAVPLPPGVKPAAGTDGHLLVWQPSTDRLWEFWRLVHNTEGWHASWGGAMQKVSSNPGVYGVEAWPGAKPRWGASASSLSIAGGLITLEDLARGQINHALAMAVPNVRASVYASPAQRTDGTSTSSLSLPEGAHLRLDPNLNLASLHLPHLTLLIAEAAQRYGIFVRDRAGEIASFYAQDPTPTGSNPYTGVTGYFEGLYPNQLLASFPWSQLQVLRLTVHSTHH